jgi:hypothetical protein
VRVEGDFDFRSVEWNYESSTGGGYIAQWDKFNQEGN